MQFDIHRRPGMPPVPRDKAAAAGAPSGQQPVLTVESALSANTPAASVADAAPHPARPRAYGLRAGLLWLLFIGLVPAVGGTAWYLRRLHDLAVQDAYAQAELIANGTAERLHWLMQDAQVAMAAVAARPRVQALDAADCDPIFRDFRDISPAYKALSLRRLDGSSVCSELQRPPSQQSLTEAPWFRAAVRRPGFYATDAHLGAVQQTWTARLTYPVKGRSTQTEGLLVTPVDLSQLQRRLFASVPAPALAAVVDASNMVVVRSQMQDERVGKPAAEGVAKIITALREARVGDAPAASRQFAEVGIDGVRRLYAIRSVPMTDWTVVAALAEDETLSGYRRSRNRAMFGFALVLLVMLAAAWRVSRGILVPIGGLARAARGFAAGDNAQRAPESGPSEIAEVAREFNRMVATIAASADKLQASESHYRTLIQHLPVAVISFRADATVEVFNPRACALLRVPEGQMAGRKALDAGWSLVDTQGVPVPASAYPINRVLASGQPAGPDILGVLAAHTPGPAHTWLMVSAYPQFDEKRRLVRGIAVFVDVTTQRQTEALRVAKEAAEAASKAKSVFLSRVSHELRTPLNAINGFSELLMLDERVPPEGKGKLQHVLNASQHLLSLINQIFDLTRIESGQIRTLSVPVELEPLLDECIAMCEPLARAKGVGLQRLHAPAGAGAGDGGAPVRVLGDHTQLRQILINLLSNAIKYNRPQGRVTVELVHRAAGSEGGSADPDAALVWGVQVIDTGIGIHESRLGELFQPFNRLGAEFSGIEGHGLGLTISRLLAQAMLGELSVESVEGQGSCFTLHLRNAPGP